ncbi:MAG TPA: NAD(P)H-quinone dehydrogenase [Mycobacteriales bacterium]|nr:NAD(P)H-quinone dehydrogenase [Mycobacteriales bacterium]
MTFGGAAEGTRIAVLGGGPGGYEAALVATELGAEVTVVDRDGLGGACVLTDCVPSKTLIATSDTLTGLGSAGALGVRVHAADGTPTVASWDDDQPLCPPDVVDVDVTTVFGRVKALALSQSMDIARRLSREGVRVVQGSGRLVSPHEIVVDRTGGGQDRVEADVILVATGATPRAIAGSPTDGERILTWRDLYDLPALPEHLVVVGSGVTGAEFASAFRALGSEVTLVSSRARVLPGEDPDAASVIDDVFRRRGISLLDHSRAQGVQRTEDGKGVIVTLTDGRAVEGSHALIAVGSIPQTHGLGLQDVGVRVDERGNIAVDRVSRTSVPGIYAAGDCTGVLLLASVAAMQGRIAMWHALGEAVAPLRLSTVASNVFTDPEIATVGVTAADVAEGRIAAKVVMLPLKTNARAKMQGIEDGFVKLFCVPGSGTVIGGVVCAPRASELVLPISLAVQNGLHADQLAYTFSVYPSLSGSITEAARQAMNAIAGHELPAPVTS